MTKRMLQSYRWLRMDITHLEEKLAELDSMARKMTTSMTGMPHGSSNIQDRMAETVTKIVDVQIEINDKVLESLERISQIEQSINCLPPREQIIMRKRYIDCMEWEQICVDMCYGWRQIHSIHSEALKAIS